ncbi:MAG: sugar nucleotide-binding protein [Anaerolineales bacterium]|nr:sugar nucleotide-binding protein [Anaerolineales bacterium]
MNRLLVTGGGGYLGRRLGRLAAAQGWQVTSSYVSTPPLAGEAWQLDLTDGPAVHAAVAGLRPTAIIHTACSNRNAAHIAAIRPAARHLAEAAQAAGARLVHVSSDMVFDGEHAPYADDAPRGPLTDYAAAKAEAEQVVGAACPAAAIGRPSLIWSLDPPDRQTEWLVSGMRRGERVTLFTDEVRCPIYLDDLAAALLALAARPDLSGPFNLGGRQALNRWEFGLRLLAALGVPRSANVLPGSVANSGLRRPRDLTLRLDRATQAGLPCLRGVDEVLAAHSLQARHASRICEG